MKIVMMSNTYKPIIGGLEKSVELFCEEYRRRGHEVLLVTPKVKGAPEDEGFVFRIQAIPNFNGTDFSVALPVDGDLEIMLDRMHPDIVHAHHPFFIGDMALRVSAKYEIPLVFTHHTLYEHYAHYVPGDPDLVKKFVMALATGYGNLCDRVIVPSQSVADIIRQRGVETPVSVVPTGIELESFRQAEGLKFRHNRHIPQDAFVIGYIGRIMPEKNIGFLSSAVADFLKKDRECFFLVAGQGEGLSEMEDIFRKNDVADQLIYTGPLEGAELYDAYQSLNVFAFASHSETQGLVLAEAMAAGVPVVAVDAPGVREVVRDKENGRLIANDDPSAFRQALLWVRDQDVEARTRLVLRARQTAGRFSLKKAVDQVLALYERLIDQEYCCRDIDQSLWKNSIREIEAQMGLIREVAKAASQTFKEKE